jgi:hypothetical protein
MSGEIEMLGHGLLNPFPFNGRQVVIDSSANVPSFPYVLFATDPAAYQIDAVVSMTECIPKYFI